VDSAETPTAASDTGSGVFLPVIGSGDPTPTPVPTAPPPPPPTATPLPRLDFTALRQSLNEDGLGLAYNKIGFHVGVGGNRNGLGRWMEELDSAGVPFFLKSVDDSGPLLEAQALMQASNVPHTLVFRTTGNDVPDYNKTPVEAAREHWIWHRDRFPPELDKRLVWLETMNELDKNRSVWLAQFAMETARLAQADGFRWAAFGWAAGEPEPEHWQTPEMLAFLRLVGNNPDTLAIALHEGSFSVDDVALRYPYTTGRFLTLFDICDQAGIPRPTVLITEWAWEAFDVPEAGQAVRDIDWAAALYGPFPEVKGAAIWYLGGGFEPIQEKAQALIAPVTEYALTHYFAYPLPPERTDTNPDLYAP
jgi:hypothetical protein